MKQSDIVQTLIYHLASDLYKDVENIIPGENYFVVTPRSTDEIGVSNYQIAYGEALDILAWMIEEDLFFGYYVEKKPDNADLSGNGKIGLIGEKDTISGTFKVEKTQTGLLIAVNKIDRRDYLKMIRSKEGFVSAANLLGVEGNIEEIVNRLYIE